MECASDRFPKFRVIPLLVFDRAKNELRPSVKVLFSDCRKRKRQVHCVSFIIQFCVSRVIPSTNLPICRVLAKIIDEGAFILKGQEGEKLIGLLTRAINLLPPARGISDNYSFLTSYSFFLSYDSVIIYKHKDVE